MSLQESNSEMSIPADLSIPPFLDRKKTKPLVYTYTILNTFKNCPEQMQRRYIKKDLGPFVETPEMRWGNNVHSAFERRIGAGKPLPADMRQWEGFALPFDGKQAKVEQKLGMDKAGGDVGYWDDSCWFRGKADTTIFNGTTAYMCDWKTGKSKYESPFELETGALLLKANNPHLTKIVGSYVWLAEDRLGQMYDLSDFAATWKTINELVREIETMRALDEWKPKPSGLCGWCNVNDCPHHP
jgi:hypothetical protein